MPGLADSRRWEILPHDVGAERALASALGLSPLVARVLVARGMRDVDEVRRFLAPDLDRDWEPPLDIAGMRAACDRVEVALASNEQIAVFGDFDVDGMSASALLTLALRRLGGRAQAYIPHRFDEGYGLTREALSRVIESCNPDLIVTVDNGIAAAREVEWLVGRGIDVVITDHHEPGDLVPEGVPVTDPKLSATCASRELAGAGVALKMVCELGRRRGMPDLWREYVDLAMLGTVSDMMVLGSENRSLVAEGIARLRRGLRPGMVALASAAGVDLASITADSLPFSLVPRLNAAGRMGTTDVAFDLLVTDDPAESSRLAATLEAINAERRETESQLADEAIAQAEETYDGGHVVVVSGEGWHEGVKGIVASRMVGRYHVPVIVFTVADGIARGSGRSVGSVDLFHAIDQCSDLLVRFGGHEGAVGVTCEAARLPEFSRRLEEVLAALPPGQFETRDEVTAIISLDELTIEGIASLEVLQPFGQGNKKPLLGVRGVVMRGCQRVGAEGNHLRFSVSDGVSVIPAIMFRAPDIERAIGCEEVVDLVFEAVNETWQGRTKPKLMVRDIVYRGSIRDDGRDGPPSGGPPALSQHGAPDADGSHVDAERASRSRAKDASPSGRELECLFGVNATEDASLRERRHALGMLCESELTDELRHRMIGEHSLLPSQQRALELLASNRSVLAVMATGRGKSLIFHLHAARQALAGDRASIFVYPLRALVGDQAFHLAAEFAELGMRAATLTGETEHERRTATYAALASGDVDVVLTTPEYLAIHAHRIAASARVGFVVVDEAHHAGTARGGTRSAYLELPRVLEELGAPVTLAVTATASTEVAREICGLLGIDEADVVVDRAVRDNLLLRDCRGLRDRDAILANVVADGKRCIVYVNSRMQSVSLTRMLRRAIPDLGERIAFYNAGMRRADRSGVEHAFRDGRLCCIVATSAFGEGVNLPDVRNVVLYHMPFGRTEFNQMSGRAGRDGRPAMIHLLFGADDARINEGVLAAASPAREGMVALYRAIRERAGTGSSSDGQGIAFNDADVARMVASLDQRLNLTVASVEGALGVFSELGLLSVRGFGDGRRVVLSSHPARVELMDSVRYAEGQREREAFAQFCAWALSSDAPSMLRQLNRPIVPDFGHVVDG